MIASLEAMVEGGRVVRLAASPPLAAKVIAGSHGPELLLVGSAASLVEGDRLRVSLRLGAGARLTVRTVAATLAHPCPGGDDTALDVDAELGPRARLAWLPEPLVACAGCRHRGRARLRLATGAAALWSESIALGRSGEEPGDVAVRLDAELNGRPLLRDGLRVGAGAPGWSGGAVLSGARHVATLALLGARAGLPDGMALAGPGELVRVLGPSAADVESRLAPCRLALLAALGMRTETPQEMVI